MCFPVLHFQSPRYTCCSVARFRADWKIAPRTRKQKQTRGADQPARRPIDVRIVCRHPDDLTPAAACGRQITATTGVGR